MNIPTVMGQGTCLGNSSQAADAGEQHAEGQARLGGWRSLLHRAGQAQRQRLQLTLL